MRIDEPKAFCFLFWKANFGSCGTDWFRIWKFHTSIRQPFLPLKGERHYPHSGIYPCALRTTHLRIPRKIVQVAKAKPMVTWGIAPLLESSMYKQPREIHRKVNHQDFKKGGYSVSVILGFTYGSWLNRLGMELETGVHRPNWWY